MNKLLWFCLLMITATGFLFSACNKDVYKDMKLIVEQESIEIVLQHDLDNADEDTGEDMGDEGQESEEEQLPPNTAYLEAHIENKNKKQSKVVLFDIMDKSLATIEVTEKDGIYTATIVALAPGQTVITVMSQEGNKVKQIPLNIVEPITGLAFERDFSLAVAKGKSYSFSTLDFNYEPSNTNQKEVLYSLETNVNGVSITQDGLLTVSNDVTEKYVTVVATSAYNPELVTTTQVYIYEELSVDDIHIYANNVELNGILNIGKNTNYNNIPVEVIIDNPTEEYFAYAEVTDNSILSVSRDQNKDLAFKVTGIEQSSAKITFKVGIKGITQQEFIEKTIDVKILDLIDTIYVNGASGSSSITVYDKYDYTSSSETAFGTRVSIEVAPTSAEDKSITFSAENSSLANLNKLEFSTASGQVIENILEYEMPNSGAIYVKLKDDVTFSEFACTLTVVGNASFSDEAKVYNHITINVKEGIQTLKFTKNELYIDLQNSDYQEVNYLVNDILVIDSNIATLLAGFELDNIKVLVQKSNVLSAIIEKGKLYVKPLATGTTTINLRAPNGVTTSSATISVVVPTDDASIDVNRTAYKEQIAGIERDENNLLTKVNLNVNSSIALYVSKVNVNGTIWNLSFQSSRTAVATITNQGSIRALSEGTTTITATFTYAKYDDLNNIVTEEVTQEIELFVFKPITQFDIGKSTATIYDLNTIGYYDAEQYSTVNFQVLMNDAYISKSQIRMYINGEAFDIQNSQDSYKIVGTNGILFYYGQGQGKFVGKIGNNLSTATVGIVAEIKEFDREYRSICNVTINKATMVNEIVVYNTNSQVVDGKTYYNMYFKTGLGTGEDTTNTQQIKISTLPATAVNGGVYYFAYDYLENNTISTSTPASEIIKVSQDGVVTPLKAGSAKVVIVPRDQLSYYDNDNDGTLSMNELLMNLQRLQAEGSQLRYKEIVIDVADGTLENPYQISSAVDYLNISTGLNAHYVIEQSIDLSNVKLSALGSEETPFTGSINGRYYVVKPTEDNPEGVYVDSKIIGVKLNQTFENVSGEINYAMFGVVKGSINTDVSPIDSIPSFSNLVIEFSEYNINIVGDYNANTTFNLGFLTAKLQGTIENVQIVMRNSAHINNNSQAKINFGGFASVVSTNTYEFVNQNGQTEQTAISSVIDSSKMIGGGVININNISSESYIGGFVGILNENNTIIGNYAFANDIVGEDNEFVFSFNGQDNDLLFNINVGVAQNINNMAVGGIVGINYGQVQKVSAYATVSSTNESDVKSQNVGGVVGNNLAEVSDVFSRSAVTGGDNVGGVVGANSGQVSVAIFESYQDGSSFVNGSSNVGGLIGLMQGGELNYGSSTSFITSENLYAVVGSSNVGGLIGYATSGAIVARSQASTKIGVSSALNDDSKYAGGLIGKAESANIQNSYSITDLYLLDDSNTTVLGGFIGYLGNGCTITNTYSVSNLDSFVGQSQSATLATSSYYLSETSSVNVAVGKTSAELQNETTFVGWDFLATFRMSSNVNQGYPYLIYGDSEFITVAPTSLKVIVNESVDNSHIKISDNRAVLFSQKSKADNASDYSISLNDLISLEVSPLTNRIVRVKATIESGLDVVKIDGGNLIVIGEGYCKIKISSQLNEDVYDYLELYVTNGLNSFSNNTDGTMEMLLNTSKEIRYTFENGQNIVGEKFGIAYKELYTYASFDYSENEQIEYVDYSFVDYNFAKNITANQVIENAVIYEIAYINANFDGEIVKVLLPWTEKSFNLTIFNGATNLELDKNQSNITPSQKAQVTTIITTDLNTEIISNVEIKSDETVIDSFSISILEGFEPNLDNIVVERTSNSNNAMFNLDLIEFVFNEQSNELLMTFEFEPTTMLQNIKEEKIFDVEFNLSDKFTKNFELIVIPQTVERISVLHFADGDLREDEVATDKISSGIEGLLKINVYPSFSQIDYLHLTCAPVNGENISFLQKVYNNGQLERIYPDAEIIENGIKLSLASYKDYEGYKFDGNLYVSTLIKSNMPENLPFVLNIVAYKDGQEVFRQTKTLYTQFSPSVTINYNENYNGQVARGTTLNFPINVNTMAGNLTLSVDGEIDPTYVVFNANQTQFANKYSGSVTAQLTTNINLIAGTQFKIRVQLDTIVDNVRIVVTDEITLTVVDYIITGVAIDGYRTQNNTNILDIDLNYATTLRAKIIAVYSQSSEEIKNKIEEFELLISRQHDVSAGDVPVWYTGTQSFDSLSGSTNYYSYNYSLKGGYYSVYGIRVSTADVITLNVSYYYDYVDGLYQPILINKATDPTTNKVIIDKTMTCYVNVNNTTTEEVPLPIYSQAEFEAMEAGAHYILMRDITLDNYTPMDANFASLDGNGFVINLNNLILDTQQSTLNVGLFATVSSSTLIKNVVLNVNGFLNNTLNLKNISQVNFGFFAGTNAGTITNCDVVNIVEMGTTSGNETTITGNPNNSTMIIETSLIINSTYTNNYIGLFVGQNSGYITHSRVGRNTDSIGSRPTGIMGSGLGNYWVGGNIDLTANGIVAGFVAMNTNSISSSYIKNVTINNNAVIASVSSTAGFVALNGGSISGSYAEGRAIEGDDYANLKSQGSVAGFVLNNDGTINNSYASFVIRSPSNSAGFVNSNGDGAIIEYCYTNCIVLLADGVTDDNASFRPFTGVNDFNEIQNEGQINYSYYIKENSTVVFADEPAIAINKENQSQISEYVGFAFVNNTKLKDYGIWTLDGYTLPYLNSANQIAVSQRELSNFLDATSQEETMNEPKVYAYMIGYELGSEINPYIINTAVKFNNLMTENGRLLERFGTNIVNLDDTVEGESLTTKYVRIVNDLNFAQTSETVTGLNSSKVIFSAVLEGNNMLLNNITVTGERSADANQIEFGLFERLEGAVIKNLRLQFNSVSATEIPIVGALAGTAIDSVLLGITVESEGSFVQGKNIAGGLVGVVVGGSEIQSVSSNIGVRATFRKGENASSYTDLNYIVGSTDTAGTGEVMLKTSQTTIKLMFGNTSYAGGIIGAVISNEGDNQTIRTLKVHGKVSIGAERTGGVVGVNYGDLYDLNFVVSINASQTKGQELSGDDAVGGIVGVNYSSIEKARISYEGDDLNAVDALTQGIAGGKTDLFIGPSNYIGGLVGSNIDGNIEDSYSRINVVNTSAKYAGGVIGYSKGGSYNSIYTTGNVQSSVAFGSMIGYMDKYTVVDENGEITYKTISEFTNIVLANNFTIATAQLINNKSVTAGALAGFVNATKISQIFEYVGSNNTNYAIYKLPLNTAGTTTLNLEYFGSSEYDKMTTEESEYLIQFANLNLFKLVEDDVETTYGWFSTKNDETFGSASYNTLYQNRSTIFSNYSSEDWTIETSVFPLLNITTQASEIIITEENRNNLLELLAEAPNATYIIRCDINLYSQTVNYGDLYGHLKGNWESLGSQAIPFSGKFLGEDIVDGNTTRQPIINIANPFINFGRNATISNLTFNVINTFNGGDIVNNNDDIYLKDNYYYGVVANRIEGSYLTKINVTNKALDVTSTQGINITYNRSLTIEGGDNIPSNYIGGVVGYASGGNFSSITCSIPMNVSLQNYANSLSAVTSYVGGVIGYMDGTGIADVNYNISYISYKNENAYQQFKVTTSNGVVGLISGYANASRIQNVGTSEVKVLSSTEESAPYGSALKPVSIVYTNYTNDFTEIKFGGIVGYANSLTIISVATNNVSNAELQMNSTYKKQFTVGGIVGLGASATMTSLLNNCILNVVSANQTSDASANSIYLGGLVGEIQGNSQVTGTNNAQINVDVQTTKNTTAYIGGVVGYAELGTIQASIAESRNTANINTNGVYALNIGGVLGRASLNSANNTANISVSSSYSDGNITVVGVTNTDINGQKYTSSNIEYIGGLVGYASRISISDCYSVGELVSKTKLINPPTNSKIGLSVGGLIGRLEMVNIEPSINYSYTACVVRVYGDTISNLTNSHSFIGSTPLSNKVFNNCYYVLGFAQTNAPYIDTQVPVMHDATAKAISYYELISQNLFNGRSTWANETNTLPLLDWARKSGMGIKTNDGTVYKPNLITNEEDLLEFCQSPSNGLNEYYVLTKNIRVTNSQTRENFAGVFDGSGFIIENLSKPLFNNLAETAIVNNINLQLSQNENQQNVAITLSQSGNFGVVANTNYGTISYVSTNGLISFNSSTVAGSTANMTNIGGIAGANFGYIGFSSSNVSIEQSDTAVAQLINVGGIAGHSNSVDDKIFAQITNSFASGTLTLCQVTGSNASLVGGLVGYLQSGNLRESYVYGRINYLNSANVTAYGAVYGGDVMNDILDDVSIEFVYNDYFGTLVYSNKNTENQTINNITLSDILNNGGLGYFDSNVWGSFASDYANKENSSRVELINYGYPYLKYANNTVPQIDNKGNGTSSLPYQITNQSGFELINYLYDVSSDKTFVYSLINDIYCFTNTVSTNIANNFINVLNGTLHGANMTIYNMNTVITDSNYGFINTISSNGSLQNIKFSNPIIEFDSNFTGGTSGGAGVGTVVGTNNGKISSVSVINATVIYEECTVSSGAVQSPLSIGGLVGINSGTITSTNIQGIDFRLGNTTSASQYINLGGYVGNMKAGSIKGASESNKDCYVENLTIRANASGASIYSSVYRNVGGFVGYRTAGGKGTISNCAVKDSNFASSGTVNVINIYNNDTVNETYVGGFLGHGEMDLAYYFDSCDVYTSINVSADNGSRTIHAGCIVGYSQTYIRNFTVYKNINKQGYTSAIDDTSNYGLGFTGGRDGIFNGYNIIS